MSALIRLHAAPPLFVFRKVALIASLATRSPQPSDLRRTRAAKGSSFGSACSLGAIRGRISCSQYRTARARCSTVASVSFSRDMNGLLPLAQLGQDTFAGVR